MADTPAGLSERLRLEGERTLEYFRALETHQWQHTIYTEGTHWSVKDLLAHFVITEMGIYRLIAAILSGEPGSPEGFDLDAYNERKVASLVDTGPEELLSQFVQARSETVGLVAGLGPDDLTRTGRHPWLGIAPLEDIIKLMYRHTQIHQRDIRRSLS